VIADAAERDLEAVAGDIILEGLDGRGVLRSSASSPPCGMEKGLWEKSTFLSSSFHSNIGKSTIQASSKRFSSTSLSIRADPGSGESRRI
jgi:hypothetical protein